MATIGSLVFCTDCGNLLPASTGNAKNILQCECCGAENPDAASSTTIVTRSKPSDLPSPLRLKLSTVQVVERHKVSTEAVDPNVQCEKCGKQGGVKYSAAQTRGADEGSTIYYTCGDCGHRWNTNN